MGPPWFLLVQGQARHERLPTVLPIYWNKEFPAESILLLTFTNKASRQMLERVEELTGVVAIGFLVEPFIM